MEYDFAVIGGGSAGYAAARTAAEVGMRTVVIEGEEQMGGLCILRGCMPSKTLIESANRHRVLLHAEEFGLRAGNIEVRMGEIQARKRRLVGEFADYRVGQLQGGDFELVRGYAEFQADGILRVQLLAGGERFVKARTVLVATGSVARRVPVSGIEQVGYWDSDAALDAEELPESLIVLGGGAVALEMAHYYSALGSRVTLIQRSGRLLKAFDSEIGEAVADSFRRRGMEVYCGTQLIEAFLDSGGKRCVRFRWGNEERVVSAAVILEALGRDPNTERLGLDRVGVAMEKRRVVCGPTQQSSVPWIFAAGDVCGPEEIVHVAIAQGELAARNAAALLRGEPLVAQKDAVRLYAVFCEPQVAVAGAGEEEARKAGLDAIAAGYPFADHGKAMVMGETDGFVKLVAGRGGELLGGSVVGPHASELIHEVAVALRYRATVAEFAAIPHYHPTLSEIWTYPAEEIAAKVTKL